MEAQYKDLCASHSGFLTCAFKRTLNQQIKKQVSKLVSSYLSLAYIETFFHINHCNPPIQTSPFTGPPKTSYEVGQTKRTLLHKKAQYQISSALIL